MLRDMETLLNTVCNEEIKLYLKEALNCYNFGAYRACIIMTMIGGVHDLHNKVKDLAPSNRDIAVLEAEINTLKNDLKPYERTLIEKCATEKIDILNPNEAKELIRCFDTRNDCAHPSDYNCSAENARYVFTTIIDILASKPILLGQQHLNTLVADINKDIFFPRKDKLEIQQIVKQQLDRYSSRIIKPLAKRLVKEIISDTSRINSNKQFFLANIALRLETDFDAIVAPLFMDSKFNLDIMHMVSANEKMIETLSNENIKRLLSILHKYTQNDLGYNSLVVDIYQSKRLDDSELDDNIADSLNTGYEQMSDNQSLIWLETTCNGNISERRFNLLVSKYKNRVINNLKFASQNYLKILIKCNDQELNTVVIKSIMDKVAESDYTVSNPATNEFEQLDEEFIRNLSDQDIEYIIYHIVKGAEGYGREVKRVFDTFHNVYVFKAFCEKIVPTFNEINLENLLKVNLSDHAIAKFVGRVKTSVKGFAATFVEVAENFISKVNTDDPEQEWNQIILTNVIYFIQREETESN